MSEQIEVRSIVGRFLEHTRIFYFENACRPKVYLGSADWMPRNFFNRIETVFPIEDGVLRDRIIHEILSMSLADNKKGRILNPDSTYRRAIAEPDALCDSQEGFMKRSLDRERQSREPVSGNSMASMKVRRSPPLEFSGS